MDISDQQFFFDRNIYTILAKAPGSAYEVLSNRARFMETVLETSNTPGKTIRWGELYPRFMQAYREDIKAALEEARAKEGGLAKEVSTP
jgi:hypothetical protein